MKVKNLMIGDWIHNNFTNDNFQVWPSFLSQATNYGKNLDRTLDDISCEPIPLTKEILELNGYKYHEPVRGMYGVTSASYYEMEGSPRIWCDGEPFAVWFEDDVDISYVHQLQLVLRLCGVEKEIKLED